ncbi:cytochrome aa3 quinol oxidase subunit II [Alkalicoccobacillus porphyridii]|uniref:cytochrome aa3 quinol oxidase subunit II n=1 Tax=Alkalicoccobacillus porphyridii TaxID=2597270 RepID=UPI0021B0CF4A|nr:cytochrome aa3 quinol oxidase subunit II [Alkalicoccobacillus porphyridii]
MLKSGKSLKWLAFLSLCLFLSGCGNMRVLDPKGPVAESQAWLIWFSIGFMLLIVLVVFVLLTVILVKYREREDHKGYQPDIEGSHKLEIIWTVIPVIIVIILSVPTIMTIFELEEAPEATAHKEPLVVHATSVNWKWIFSYPEEDIETINYLNIPTDRPILFRLTSADSMAAMWIPQLGGQKYNMAGMETQLFLQADHVGTYGGRNANYTGDGFAQQTFDVHAFEQEDFDSWVEETQENAPELTPEEYDKLMVPGTSTEMTFSSTHLDWVDHSTNAEYALDAWDRMGYIPLNPHTRAGKAAEMPHVSQLETGELEIEGLESSAEIE